MTKLPFIKQAKTVDSRDPAAKKTGADFVISLRNGMPIALNNVAPVISVEIANLEQESEHVLQSAELLLPQNRKAPGIVVIDKQGKILGVAPRREMELAVLEFRRGEAAIGGETIGAASRGKSPAGDPVVPFVYWKCPECGTAAVAEEQQFCQKHEPPIAMKRIIY